MSYNEDLRVIIQAFEFWCSISDEEVVRIQNNTQTCMNYCASFKDDLMNIIKYHFVERINGKYDEEDSWNPTKASSVLLNNLCTCVGLAVVNPAVEFIGEYIKHDNPKLRDSALLAYGAVLETPSESIAQIVIDSIDTLFNMVSNDPSNDVKITASWCIERVAQFHCQILYSDYTAFDKFFNNIIQTLQRFDHTTISINSINTIHFLALGSMTWFGPDKTNCKSN